MVSGEMLGFISFNPTLYFSYRGNKRNVELVMVLTKEIGLARDVRRS